MMMMEDDDIIILLLLMMKKERNELSQNDMEANVHGVYENEQKGDKWSILYEWDGKKILNDFAPSELNSCGSN